LTAALQNYARKYTIAVDKLSFNYTYLDTMTFKDVTEKPEDGALIYGLYLEGCKWSYDTH